MKPIILVLLALVGAAHAAELYRWVDSEGKIHYSDQMPPAGTNYLQKKQQSPNVIQSSELPYVLQVAVKSNPVTLYITNCGEGCDKAREHLVKRGVPYTSKNPETAADAEALKKLINSLEVPVLVLGGNRTVRGYNAAEWDKALDIAGYPKTSALRAPIKPKESKAKESPKTESGAPAAAPADTPAGVNPSKSAAPAY